MAKGKIPSGYGGFTAGRQRSLLRAAASKSLRGRGGMGVGYKSTKMPTKILTGLGNPNAGHLGYASKSPYNVAKPINGKLGGLVKGKIADARSTALPSGGVGKMPRIRAPKSNAGAFVKRKLPTKGAAAASGY
jgi:hypothetical protein